MIKKLLIAIALSAGLIVLPSAAAMATDTVDQYCVDVFETQVNPLYVPAVDQWFSWTGSQSETHPFPSGDWNPDNGNHNGQPFQGHINEAFQVSQGNSVNWFYHQITPAIGEPTILVKTGENCVPRPPADRETRAVEDEPTCESDTVATWTEERTRLYFILISVGWQPGDWSGWSVVADSQSTRALTAEEVLELACQIDDPPPPPPPVNDPPPPGTPQLAETGLNPWFTGLTSVLLLGTGGTLIGISRRMF